MDKKPPIEFLCNINGRPEVLEFNINEVTQNPIPNDIYQFKRLATQGKTMKGVRVRPTIQSAQFKNKAPGLKPNYTFLLNDSQEALAVKSYD